MAVGLVLGLTSAAFAAEAPRPPSSEAVQLSPFLVSTEGDEGYRAANTLSGTRMNASLFHTPAAISVLTREFLDDIGAENVADMLKFATSSDNDRTDSGNLAQAWDVRATIRGFTESVIRGMTRLANQHGALNLSQGFPDFDPPEALLAALERATRGPHRGPPASLDWIEASEGVAMTWTARSLQPELPIVDPHHHLWGDRPDRPIAPRYYLEELRLDTNSGHYIDKTVFIECGESYHESGPEAFAVVGETERMVIEAERSRKTAGAYIAGIVSSADFRLPVETIAEVLAAHEAAGQGLFRGIRGGRFRFGGSPRPLFETHRAVFIGIEFREPCVGVRLLGPGFIFLKGDCSIFVSIEFFELIGFDTVLRVADSGSHEGDCDDGLVFFHESEFVLKFVINANGSHPDRSLDRRGHWLFRTHG